MSEVFDNIRQWANDRNLIYGSNPAKQYGKLLEEVGELGTALMENDLAQISDALGDCVVVLTIIAAQNDYSLEACIEAAYEEIKDRKGKMINGVFVKDAA
jgi:NTP pyrophosphatase (non-canonical NTP hydrolase)